ncbi:MAG: helix-turn-helix domain-containing protein [Eubacterium sp.]|nr:helix-turn-helix domain-containing protein [Eubacterium sp.]
MKNAVQIFNNPEFGSVRTLMIANEPWWVGKDVAKALGYERCTKAIQDHVDNDDKDGVPIQDTIGRMQSTIIINESGLYSLILSSKLPNAKKFKHWITSEVLPAIRKTGKYEMGSAKEIDYLKAAEMLASCSLDRLPYVIAVLKQGGIAIPDPPVKIAIPPVHTDRGGRFSQVERDRMQYETLRQYPQLIEEYPEAVEKFPDLKELIPKKSNKPPQLQRSVSRAGYTTWFNNRKLTRMMKKKDMTLNVLAEKSGIDRRSLNRYLSGECRPGEINRNKLCDAMEVKYGYFDK